MLTLVVVFKDVLDIVTGVGFKAVGIVDGIGHRATPIDANQRHYTANMVTPSWPRFTHFDAVAFRSGTKAQKFANKLAFSGMFSLA